MIAKYHSVVLVQAPYKQVTRTWYLRVTPVLFGHQLVHLSAEHDVEVLIYLGHMDIYLHLTH